MKLTLKSSLGKCQKAIKEGLAHHPEVLDSFKHSSPFGNYLDVEFIPPPLMIWEILSRESKVERDGELWFVVHGVPVRYSLMEFALISGLNCSELNTEFEALYDANARKNFLEAHFPLVLRDKKSIGVTYNMVVKCFNEVCKLLDNKDDENKKKTQIDAVRMATLLFIVVVLLAPADHEKFVIPDWILGLVGQWKSLCNFPWGTWAFMESLVSLKKDLVSKAESLHNGGSATIYYIGFVLPLGILLLESCSDFAARFAMRRQQTSPAQPRICLWKGISNKKKITHKEVENSMNDVQSVQSILCPDKESEEHLKDLAEHLVMHKNSEEYKNELANHLEKYNGSKEHKKDLADHLEEYKKSEEYQKELADHENAFLQTERFKDIVAKEVVRSFIQGVSIAQCRVYDALRKRCPDFDVASWGLPAQIEDPTGVPPAPNLVDGILPVPLGFPPSIPNSYL
ncbi:unnamed protein product [Cuscuta campestris]|uniref:DUF1985 domain-containing protein n=1 Tax=Cuscuta campestris TaxID=132261 RepID=A0A484MZS4_9ASTE|nr:unnamed protein product [Cuscuta campestris]